MAAITTFAELTAGMAHGSRSDTFLFANGNVGLVIGGWLSTFSRYQPGAVIPTAPASLNSATPGAVVSVPLTSTKQLWLTELEFAANGAAVNTRFNAVLYDRLSHCGGLVGNVTTEQTTNLPTAALTRYTDGEGVIPFLEVYATLGAAATTCTIRYTNQAGVANRVSKPIAVTTGQNQAQDCITPFMLQSGDTGCRSVQGLTFSGATPSAGSVGITLMKKIATMPVDTGSYTERQGYRQMMFHGGVVEIQPGAFLQLCWMPSTNSTGAWNMMGRVGIIEK